jgi:futalosine hydrolase
MALPTVMHANRLYYNEIPLSTHHAEKALQLADYYGVKLVCGRFITVSTCSGSRQQGEELAGRFQGICENMEGAAVAQTCLRYGIDCLEIRGISNLVDQRDMKTWDIPQAVEAAQRFVLKFIEKMDRPIPQVGENHAVPDL